MDSKSILICGGRQRPGRDLREWHQYEAAVIARLDVESGSVTVPMTYVSPLGALPDGPDPCIVFKAGTLKGRTLYSCTQTEVMAFTLPAFDMSFYLSQPEFNDVHHVLPLDDGTLAVVSTGLDAVFQMNRSGAIVKEWSTSGTPIWDRFDRTRDWRQVATTKPHRSHPNYCFMLDDRLWTTRFEQRDAICLDVPELRFDINAERPHDGVFHDGRILFSSVDGHILAFDPHTRRLLEDMDLNLIAAPSKEALGWCRGLLPLGDTLLVGFSRIRPTPFRQSVNWVRRNILPSGGAANEMPTRVAAYDLRRKTLLWEVSLEGHGVNAIFSMHAEPA